MNDKLVYWVLMPALFFRQISIADLGAEPFGPFAAALYSGFFAAVIFGWGAARILGYRPDVTSSVMQGSSRFNTFVALAIAEALHGVQGLQLAVLAAALLVPIVNVAVVVAMTLMLSTGEGKILRRATRDLLRNPLILSIAAGVFANFLGLGGAPILDDTARILGAAALPAMLLCVGANLRIRGMSGAVTPLALASVGKFVVFPLAMVAPLILFPPGVLAGQIALIYAALPTGVAAYTLARAMGGDAPLMARMITVQTGLAFVTIPLTLELAKLLIGF